MELKITSNFSFGKLERKIEGIQKHNLNKQKTKIVDIAKKNITEKKLRPLKQSTLDSRKAGKYWGKKRGNQYKTNDDTPLKHMGHLLDSIKSTKDGIEMLEYGMTHQKEWTTNRGVTIKARPFLPFTKTGNLTPEMKEFQDKFERLFTLRIKQAMKK